jgi:hypothetical protein
MKRRGGAMSNGERQKANGKLADIFYIEQDIRDFGFNINGLDISQDDKEKLKQASIPKQAEWVYDNMVTKKAKEMPMENSRNNAIYGPGGQYNNGGVYHRLNKDLKPAEQKAENNREAAQLNRVTKRKMNALNKHAKRMQRR